MQYSYTTTPVREAALSAVVAEANAAIDAQNAVLAKQTPPGTPLSHVTSADYLTARIDEVLDSYGRQHQQAIAGECVTAFVTAPQAAQAQVLAILGMTDYLSLPTSALEKALVAVGLPAFMALSMDEQNQCFTLVGLGQ